MVNCLFFLVLHMVGFVSGALVRRDDTRPVCTATLDGHLPDFTPSNFRFSGNVRRYYIAAEEIEWNYAPSGWDNWLGVRGTDTWRSRYRRVDNR
jgi:hypothetical protein